MTIIGKFLVTYKFRNGVASADFMTFDEALKFASNVRGSRIYKCNDKGVWERVV